LLTEDAATTVPAIRRIIQTMVSIQPRIKPVIAKPFKDLLNPNPPNTIDRIDKIKEPTSKIGASAETADTNNTTDSIENMRDKIPKTGDPPEIGNSEFGSTGSVLFIVESISVVEFSATGKAAKATIFKENRVINKSTIFFISSFF